MSDIKLEQEKTKVTSSTEEKSKGINSMKGKSRVIIPVEEKVKGMIPRQIDGLALVLMFVTGINKSILESMFGSGTVPWSDFGAGDPPKTTRAQQCSQVEVSLFERNFGRIDCGGIGSFTTRECSSRTSVQIWPYSSFHSF